MNYVCKIDEKNVIKKCPSNYDLVEWGNDEICLMWKSSKKEWIWAEGYCKDYGGNLVQILNEQQQKAFNAWHRSGLSKSPDILMKSLWFKEPSQRKTIDGWKAKGNEYKKSTFIGLTDIYSDSGQMEWSHSGIPNYQNWIYGEPEASESKYPGHSCGCIPKENYKGLHYKL